MDKIGEVTTGVLDGFYFIASEESRKTEGSNEWVDTTGDTFISCVSRCAQTNQGTSVLAPN